MKQFLAIRVGVGLVTLGFFFGTAEGQVATNHKLTEQEQRLEEEAAELHAASHLDRKKNDFEAARRKVEGALAIRRKLYPIERYPDGHAATADTLNSMGFVLNSMDRPQKAFPFYEEALEMRRKLHKGVEAHPELANSLNNLASVFNSLGEPQKALPLYEEALAMRRKLYREVDGHPNLATSLSNMGFVLKSLSQPQKALPFYEEALAMRRNLYKDVEAHPNLATSLNAMGQILESLGKYENALAFYEEALAMRRNLHKDVEAHPDLARGLSNLGHALDLLGQPDRALPLIEEALAMRRKLHKSVETHPDLARSLSNMGYVLESLGQLEKAFPYYEEALGMRRKLHKDVEAHPDLARSLHCIGFILNSLGQSERALTYYEEALAMDRKLYKSGEAHPNIALRLNNIGSVFEALNQPQKALPFYEEALAMRRKLYQGIEAHPDLANSLNNLGVLLESMSQPEKALPLLEETLVMDRKTYKSVQAHPEHARHLNNMGSVLESLGQPEKALFFYEEALMMYDSLTESIGQMSSLSDSTSRLRSLPDTLAAYLSVSREVNQVSPVRIWDRMFASKSILSRLEERRHLLNAATMKDLDSKGKHQDYLNVVARLGILVNSTPLLGVTPEAKKHRAEQEAEIARLTNRREELEAKLLVVNPEYARLKELDKLGPLELSGMLERTDVFVDLIRYRHWEKRKPADFRYAAFLVGKDKQVKRVEFDNAQELDDALADWLSWIDSKVSDSDKLEERRQETIKRGELVRKLLWIPLQAAFPKGVNRVYIAPDGALNSLPWGAIPGEKADSILLEDYTFAVVPHGPYLLKHLKYPPKSLEKKQVLAIGGVDYDNPPQKLLKSEYESKLLKELRPTVARAKPLPGAEKELKLFANLDGQRFSVRTVSGNQAGAVELTRSMPGVNMLHIATHGFFNKNEYESEKKRSDEQLKHFTGNFSDLNRQGQGARNPLSFAGLLLAGCNNPDTAGLDGGILTGDAIQRLKLQEMELAVLSACETGLGVRLDGECVFTLRQAFHGAGCRNVVATLWEVPDKPSAALIGLFYRKVLIDNKTPLEALREAQLFLYHHPEQIDGLYEQFTRGRPQDIVAEAPKEEPKPLAKGATKKAPLKSWAGFQLSGVGK